MLVDGFNDSTKTSDSITSCMRPLCRYRIGYDWMQRLSRSLSRFETQDIKTQPLFNHYLSNKKKGHARPRTKKILLKRSCNLATKRRSHQTRPVSNCVSYGWSGTIGMERECTSWLIEISCCRLKPNDFKLISISISLLKTNNQQQFCVFMCQSLNERSYSCWLRFLRASSIISFLLVKRMR